MLDTEGAVLQSLLAYRIASPKLIQVTDKVFAGINFKSVCAGGTGRYGGRVVNST